MEYILLPHNDEVIKPRALNTFLDGLTELGVDKRLIKNKKILSDLLEKEKIYRDNEGEGDDDSNRSDSSDGEESQSESNDAESVSESERESIIQQESSKPCHHFQNRNMSVTTVVKCSRCFWHDNNSICPICDYDIPVDKEHIKEAFARCNDCGATCHKNIKTSKVSFYFPSEDKN